MQEIIYLFCAASPTMFFIFCQNNFFNWFLTDFSKAFNGTQPSTDGISKQHRNSLGCIKLLMKSTPTKISYKFQDAITAKKIVQLTNNQWLVKLSIYMPKVTSPRIQSFSKCNHQPFQRSCHFIPPPCKSGNQKMKQQDDIKQNEQTQTSISQNTSN